MKSNLKYLKKLKQETDGINEILSGYFEKIKKEHNKILIQQMNELIKNIASGEKLDENELREKYLTTDINSETKKTKKNKFISDIELLDVITIDSTKYYYENKEDGNVYDTKSIKVGTYINNEFHFI